MEGIERFKRLIAELVEGTQKVGVYLLELAGAVIVIMIIWAGLQYIQGNAEAGKKTLVAAVIGAIIVALASTIVQLVHNLGGF